MTIHNIVELLRLGVCVTINSDESEYFGDYMTDKFIALADAHPMGKSEIAQFTLNAINASFVTDQVKKTI